jgi:hypothetical protein
MITLVKRSDGQIVKQWITAFHTLFLSVEKNLLSYLLLRYALCSLLGFYCRRVFGQLSPH